MNELVHHGIKGQKWGVRRFQNKDGTLTEAGKKRYYKYSDTVFISGKVSFDEEIPSSVKREVDRIIKSKANVVIGDAPGADTRVQQYLASKNYNNVVVYSTDNTVRNNVGNWKVKYINDGVFTDEKSWRAQKDIAMEKVSTRGLAISSIDDRPDSAMSLNLKRLRDSGKPTTLYDFKTKQFHYQD